MHRRFSGQQAGKIIRLEAARTREFSGNPLPAPRYDYNERLCRLNLSDSRLEAAR